jgi:hypothetical protein
MKLIILILSIILIGCASAPKLSSKALNIQIIQQDSVLLAKCKVINSVTATRSELMQADDVYNLALADALEQSAALGADAITVTNVGHNALLKNTVRIQAAALDCYQN